MQEKTEPENTKIKNKEIIAHIKKIKYDTKLHNKWKTKFNDDLDIYKLNRTSFINIYTSYYKKCLTIFNKCDDDRLNRILATLYKIEEIKNKLQNKTKQTKKKIKELTQEQSEKQTIEKKLEIYKMLNGIFIDINNFFDICNDENSEAIISSLLNINVKDLFSLPTDELPKYLATITNITQKLRKELIQDIKAKDYDTLVEAIAQHVIMAVLRSCTRNGILYEEIARDRGLLNLSRFCNIDNNNQLLWEIGPILNSFYESVLSDNKLDQYNIDNGGSLFAWLRSPVITIIMTPTHDKIIIQDPIPPSDPPTQSTRDSSTTVYDPAPPDLNKFSKSLLTPMQITELSIVRLWQKFPKKAIIYMLYIRGHMTISEVCNMLRLSQDKSTQNKIDHEFREAQTLLEQIRRKYERDGREAFNEIE